MKRRLLTAIALCLPFLGCPEQPDAIAQVFAPAEQKFQAVDATLSTHGANISALLDAVDDLRRRIEALESAEHPAPPPPMPDPQPEPEPQPNEIPHGTRPGGTPSWLTGDSVRSVRPPSGWTAALPWLNVIYDPNQGQGQPAKVSVRSLDLMATVGGQTVRLGGEIYPQTRQMCGGRWRRYRNDDPAQGLAWFSNENTQPLSGLLSFDAQGRAVLDAGQDPLRIWHTWTCARVGVPSNATRVWVQARVEVQGAAVVGIGLDWWRNLTIGYGGPDVNNTEASWSIWYYARSGEQTISVGAPAGAAMVLDEGAPDARLRLTGGKRFMPAEHVPALAP